MLFVRTLTIVAFPAPKWDREIASSIRLRFSPFGISQCAGRIQALSWITLESRSDPSRFRTTWRLHHAALTLQSDELGNENADTESLVRWMIKLRRDLLER